jgi:hypothetical protein
MTYPRIVTAHHGTSEEAVDILLGGADFFVSAKPWEWLGPGAYFFEWSLERAWDWALSKFPASPGVVAARIDLSNCLDLTNPRHAERVRAMQPDFIAQRERFGLEIPRNENGRNNLDCALLAFAIGLFRREGQEFDSVRCAYPEGVPIFSDGAGNDSKIFTLGHVQIAVLNQRCIIERFRP